MSRREVDQHLFGLQYELIFDRAAPAATSSETHRRRLLRVAGSFLERVHFDAVVEERSVNDRCGYPICSNALPPRHARSTAKYRVAPRQGKVYANASSQYCCESCAVAAAYFSKQLSSTGVHVRDLSHPIRIRLLDDPPPPADAWLSDGPALRALFARIRLQRTRPSDGAVVGGILQETAAAAAVTPAPAPAVLADVVREVVAEKRNASAMPVIGSNPLAIDGYVPKMSRTTASQAARHMAHTDDDDDDANDDGIDVNALRKFLETGDEAHRVENENEVDGLDGGDGGGGDDDDGGGALVAAFGQPVPSIGVESYSDFVRLWLLFDIWRPDASLGAAVEVGGDARQVDESDVVPVADSEEAVLVTDVVTSQTGMRARALANLLRDAFTELERRSGATLDDEWRRTALATLTDVARASKLRDAVPALTPRARAWLALVLLEARQVAWPNAKDLVTSDERDQRFEQKRHVALVNRAQEVI